MIVDSLLQLEGTLKHSYTDKSPKIEALRAAYKKDLVQSLVKVANRQSIGLVDEAIMEYSKMLDDFTLETVTYEDLKVGDYIIGSSRAELGKKQDSNYLAKVIEIRPEYNNGSILTLDLKRTENGLERVNHNTPVNFYSHCNDARFYIEYDLTQKDKLKEEVEELLK